MARLLPPTWSIIDPLGAIAALVLTECAEVGGGGRMRGGRGKNFAISFFQAVRFRCAAKVVAAALSTSAAHTHPHTHTHGELVNLANGN